MIHSITIENFFSVADSQVLNFRVPANAPDLGCFRDSRAVPGQRLPLIVGVYGPNASGKSTVLRAISTTAWFVQHSFTLPPNNAVPFFNPYAHNNWWNLPTKIAIEYDGQLGENTPPAVFRYELHIANEPNKFGSEVNYESLSYAPHGKFRRIFERHQQKFTFGKEFGITGGAIATFKHFGLDCDIVLAQESMGTRRFIEIFPLLQFVLDNGGVAVIDEMDTDIHPLLVPELFRWFYDKERNPKGAQLLFTAHNPAILDQLEKEQVFFSEKPSGKPTHIYGAREIKGLRREPSLMRKYLSGELGAVPHIG